jgi:hypothetical protein
VAAREARWTPPHPSTHFVIFFRFSHYPRNCLQISGVFEVRASRSTPMTLVTREFRSKLPHFVPIHTRYSGTLYRACERSGSRLPSARSVDPMSN